MLLHYPRRFGTMRKDDLRILSHQVRRRGIGSWVVAARDAKYELQIAALAPSEGRKPLRESGEIALRHRVALRKTHEHPDPSHPRLLPPRRKRPRRSAAEQRYERAALHSITSSAVVSNVGETVRPSARAVFIFNTTWKFVGCSTGRLAGFAPLMILST